jgi:hypothetical protein
MLDRLQIVAVFLLMRFRFDYSAGCHFWSKALCVQLNKEYKDSKANEKETNMFFDGWRSKTKPQLMEVDADMTEMAQDATGMKLKKDYQN